MQHREADVVGELARLAEGAGEEDPQQVEHDRDDEDVRRPVVRLADQQPGLAVEGQVDRGRGRRSSSPGRAAAGSARGRRLCAVLGSKKKRQVDARRDEDEERVERDLAEQERPVVGEDVAQRLAQERRRAGALVEEADERRGSRESASACRTPHQDGADRAGEVPAARRWPRASTRAAAAAAAGRPGRRAPRRRRRVERRVVARADERGPRLRSAGRAACGRGRSRSRRGCRSSSRRGSRRAPSRRGRRAGGALAASSRTTTSGEPSCSAVGALGERGVEGVRARSSRGARAGGRARRRAGGRAATASRQSGSVSRNGPSETRRGDSAAPERAARAAPAANPSRRLRVNASPLSSTICDDLVLLRLVLARPGSRSSISSSATRRLPTTTQRGREAARTRARARARGTASGAGSGRARRRRRSRPRRATPRRAAAITSVSARGSGGACGTIRSAARRRARPRAEQEQRAPRASAPQPCSPRAASARSATQTPTSAAPAISHATSPRGSARGGRSPSRPRSCGCFAYWT